MARPRSEDKRQTILRAAIQLFAEEGLNAPTARIAKLAGVAEGTVFTYFTNKDGLQVPAVHAGSHQGKLSDRRTA